MLDEKEIGAMWAEHYAQRNKLESALLLTAIVDIIIGHVVIKSRTPGDYSQILDVLLQGCNVPMVQFRQIKESNIE
jgi:hypothetical protein